MDNQTVTMAHGAGGKQTSELIDKVFAAHFANPDLTADDAAVLTPPVGKMAVSTDGFIVSPAFFPGGNIGKLSICGTVNDLACMGAKPLYLTCAFVIEEGFPMEKLEEIAAAMEKTAKEAGVRIVSGDTKVAGKGQVDGVFITTTGMGQIENGVKVGGELAQPGDAIIVTGDVGRHGCTILLAREDFGIEADVTSDCAPLWHTVEEVINATHDLHVIRDATRGGVGTVLYEIAGQSNVGIRLDAEKAEQYKQQAIEELTALGVTFPVEMDYYIAAANQVSLDSANVLKQCFSDSLGDDYVTLNIMTYVSSSQQEVIAPSLHSALFGYGWGADYGDPQNYLGQETYGNDNAYFSASYNYINEVEANENTQNLIDTFVTFTEMVEAADAIHDDLDARYQAYAEAEAYMIQHAICIPNYYDVGWCLSKINLYSQRNAMFGCQNNKMKNWETSVDGYTTEEMEAFKQAYLAE